MVKTRYPQPKEGKARILIDEWPEMLTFVFEKSEFPVEIQIKVENIFSFSITRSKSVV